MFGGSQKNVFGENRGQSSMFGQSLSRTSGLFGMPPIPDIQKPSPESSSAPSNTTSSLPGQTSHFMPSNTNLFAVPTQSQDQPSSFAPSSISELFGKKPQTSVFGGSGYDNATPASSMFKSSAVFSSKSDDTKEAEKKDTNIFGANAGGAQIGEISFKSFNKPQENQSVKPNFNIFSSNTSSESSEGFLSTSTTASSGPDIFKRPTELPFGNFRSSATSSDVPTNIQSSALNSDLKETSNPFQATHGNLPKPVFGTASTGSDATFGKSDFGSIFGKKLFDSNSSKPPVLFGKAPPVESQEKSLVFEPNKQNPHAHVFGSSPSKNLRNPFRKSFETDTGTRVSDDRGNADIQKSIASKKLLVGQSSFLSDTGKDPRQSNFLQGSSNLFGKSIDQVKRSAHTGNQELISGSRLKRGPLVPASVDLPDLFKNVEARKSSQESLGQPSEPPTKRGLWNPYKNPSVSFGAIAQSSSEGFEQKQFDVVAPLFTKKKFAPVSQDGLDLPPPVFSTSETQKASMNEQNLFRPLKRTGRTVPEKESLGTGENLFDPEMPAVPKEVIQESRAIVCKDVPKEAIENKKVLEKHFSKFGAVIKVITRPSKSEVEVHFSEHKSAKLAKLKGLTIFPNFDPIGSIFYKKPTTKSPKMKSKELPKKSESSVDMTKLYPLTKRQAFSDADRCTILEARDEIVRLTDVSTKESSSRLGTCQDMCPEKERYMRSDRNQLRLYEKIDGEPHHEAIVKEYSRSSADQKMPLLHELRPPHILKMTMDHILCNIVDRVEDTSMSISDWYRYLKGGREQSSDQSNETLACWFEYIWSATRAIRKDIVHQDLKDLVTVSLVEKCARFHILCAERLIEEDPSSFDKKLNDENLTKCMQTLKYMYEDLRLSNMQCPNEPEFRAYGVILKLNDGDTLINLDTLPQWVRESQEMRFALSIYSALNTNNYVKFFKLVRDSTLLQGCLLLRYFHQVRSQALSVMVKAFCFKNNRSITSLWKLSELLAFEDIYACATFVEMHGLSFDDPDNPQAAVILERSSFQSVDHMPERKRAINVIESKLNGLQWSYIMNGGPLPSNPYLSYKPQCSFDANGLLKNELMSEAGLDHSFSLEDSSTFPIASPPKPSVDVSRELQEICDDIVEGGLLETVQEVALEAVHSIKLEKASTEVVSETIDLEVEVLAREIASETIKAAMNLELQKRLDEDAIECASEEIVDEIIEMEIKTIISNVVTEEMSYVKKELDLQKMMDQASSVVEDLCENCILSEIEGIAENAIKLAREELDLKVEDLLRRQSNRLMNSCFQRWRKITSKHRRQHQILSNFPSMPSTLTPKKQLERLGSSPLNHLKRAERSSHNISMLLDAISLEDAMVSKAILEKIDIHQIVRDAHPCVDLVQFKLVVCVPSLSSESPHRPFNAMLRRKLSREETTDNPSILTCFSQTDENGRRVDVCVRYITSEILTERLMASGKDRREFLMGTSAILFVYIDEEEDMVEAEIRLKNLVYAMARVPPVPVQVLLASDVLSSPENGQIFGLQHLLNERRISELNVTNMTSNIFDLKSIAKAHSCLDWLASVSHPTTRPDDILAKSITNYVEDFLGVSYVTDVRNNLEKRLSHKLPHQNPNALIDFYNAAVNQLEIACLSDKLADVSWPCPEFFGSVFKRPFSQQIPSYWNDPAYLDNVVTSIRSLKLPAMSDEVQDELDPNVLTELVLQYFQRLIKSYIDGTFCESLIVDALQQAKWDGETQIPWTDIIDACIEYKLKCLDTQDRFSTSNIDMKVVYFQKDLSNMFLRPKSWQEGTQLRREEAKAKMKREKQFLSDLTQSPAKKRSNLSKMLADELEKSKAFDEKLKEALRLVSTD